MRKRRFLAALVAAGAALSAGAPALAQAIPAVDVLKGDAAAEQATAPREQPVAGRWSVDRAEALLDVVNGIGREGLDPADYYPEELQAAIAGGRGERLDEVAGAIFGWLVEDMRDGRTPLSARRAYLMEDPDAALWPVTPLMQRALATGDVAGVIASIAPTHPDYAALRVMLSITPEGDAERRTLIRANLDRWRWLPRDLGDRHLMVNVPEFMLRLDVNGYVVRDYRVIVGRPGGTATPQMSEMVEGVIFNPTWTVPQSIVVGEGLGGRVLNNPAWARARGYTATRNGDRITVVQQPGPANALGKMKLDMPNAHAIFLHDTPTRQLFDQDQRALSHGCVRVQNAMELALTLMQMGEGATVEEALAVSDSGEYTRMPLTRQIPVYLGYFTARVNADGQLVEFADLYGRDAPVLASLREPRQRVLLPAS